MLLYNVTVILESSIEDEWLEWIKTVHVPGVMATNCFVSSRILKVLDSPNEGVTYCIQCIADSPGQYDEFKQRFEPVLSATHTQRFLNKFVMFNTLMEFTDSQ